MRAIAVSLAKAVGDEYIVMYSPKSQPGESYAWARPTELGNDWTPERRCNAISNRLESYRPDGLLELRTAVLNNENIVCVTSQEIADCRIVLTVPPEQSAAETRDGVFDNIRTADGGQVTDAVTTLTSSSPAFQTFGNLLSGLGSSRRGGLLGGSSGTDLRPFLDPSDGGTGTQIERGFLGRARPSIRAIFYLAAMATAVVSIPICCDSDRNPFFRYKQQGAGISSEKRAPLLLRYR